MKVASISSSLLADEGRRLGPRAFVDGSIAARKRIRELPYRRLGDVTAGFKGGIFTHLFSPKRTYVSSHEYGVPFLGASSMLLADLSGLPLISKKDADSRSYRPLTIREGMTLISCSGSVGRMVYARSDMDGMISAGDILKVQPNPKAIRSGYLFAFLNSHYGRLLVNAGTYGTIVQHLEPRHITEIPVPKLGAPVERRAHELVKEAARLRVRAAVLRSTVVSSATAALKWASRPAHDLWTQVEPTSIQRRLDAFYHASGIVAARRCLAKRPSVRLGNAVAEVFEPNRGARRKVEDPKYGVQFLSSSEIFCLDPVGDYFISRSRTPHIERQLLGETDLLLPRSGQLGGIIGKAVLPLPSYYGSAASEHLVRIRCRTRDDAFFAWAIFATEPGYYAAIGTAFGSSIPSLDCGLLADLQLPWWKGAKRDQLVCQVEEMVKALSRAISAERAAVALVERAIQEAA
jgi:type I restriction enzyme, S subunit